MTDTETSFDEWAILELMGHKRLAGKVSEAVIAGAAMVRIDVPGIVAGHPELDHHEWVATQYYSPGSVYCITPVAEDVARAVAARTTSPVPVTRWELEPPRARANDEVEAEIDDAYDDRPFES